MPAPTLQSFAQELYDHLGPMQWDEAKQAWALANYVACLGNMFQIVEDYSRDQGDAPGWSQIVDLDRAPAEALPWLAQFIGVRLQEGLTTAAQRDRIRGTDGWRRGTPGAIIAAAQQYLTGSKTVILRERDPAACAGQPAYGLSVITEKTQTPVEDWPTTNLVPNGGLEVDNSGWSAGSATVVRDTAVSRYGLASAKATPTSSSGGVMFINGGTLSGSTAGRVFTASGWIYATGAAVGKIVRLQFNENGGATGETGVIAVDTTLVSGWQRVACTGPLVQNDRTGMPLYVTFLGTGWTSIPIWVDGVQLEEQPTATPYVDTNGAVASRPAGQGPVGAALRAQKPAGIILRYVVLNGQDFQTLYTNHPTLANVYSTYATFQGVVADVPGT